MERVLADIDANHGNCGVECLGHSVLLGFGAPSQHSVAGSAGARPVHPINGHAWAPYGRLQTQSSDFDGTRRQLSNQCRRTPITLRVRAVPAVPTMPRSLIRSKLRIVGSPSRTIVARSRSWVATSSLSLSRSTVSSCRDWSG